MCFPSHVTRYISSKLDSPGDSIRHYRRGRFLLASLSVLTGQPLTQQSRLHSQAGNGVALAAWMLGSLVVASAYKSMILALLVKVDYEEPLTSTEVKSALG